MSSWALGIRYSPDSLSLVLASPSPPYPTPLHSTPSMSFSLAQDPYFLAWLLPADTVQVKGLDIFSSPQWSTLPKLLPAYARVGWYQGSVFFTMAGTFCLSL